jgi:hypothetical protein
MTSLEPSIEDTSKGGRGTLLPDGICFFNNRTSKMTRD